MEYWCSNCKEIISEKIYQYSKQNHGSPLCINCQKQNNSDEKKRIYKKRKKQPTPEAHALYKALKERGVPAEYEKWDGYKHIDIAVVESKVNIEVDGSHHNFKSKQALSDLKRTIHSFKKGYVTLRIPNALVKENLDETADYIVKLLNESNEQLDSEEYDSW